MKKSVFISLTCLLSYQINKAQVINFSDNFETYTAGQYLGPQSPAPNGWTTWSNADGGTEDVKIDTVKAHSGTKSIYFTSTLTAGGPTDCVLPFQGPHNTGSFMFKAWFFVGIGKDAYFNFQANPTAGQQWSVDCFMNTDSSLVFSNSGVTMLTSTYPQNAWFELKVDANLNNSLWTVSVNGTPVGVYHNPVYKISSIDIYPVDNNASFWVDDVSFTHTPYTLPAVNGGLPFLTVSDGLVSQTRIPVVEVRNLGTTAITSFDITFGNGSTTLATQSVTGANIASLATTTVTSNNPITLTTGTNIVWAKISNVNGAGMDGDVADDSIGVTLHPVQAAAGKMVIAEEATGTWCGWCPRGAVALANMEKYDGYFQGIAVHNGGTDPMTVADYDGPLGATSFPGAMVDRNAPFIDPTGIEAQFLQHITMAPKAFLVNGATFNTTTHELKVSITTTFQQNVSGDYRIACALAEDSVKGTASGYNQANYYSSSAQNAPLVGAGHNWQTSPNPVPAAQMQYDHVARLIKPAFDGAQNSFPATINSGAVYTHNFTLYLDPAWKPNYIHIVGMLIDPNGKIDNASSTTIAKAISNGFVPGTDVTVGVTKFDAPDQQIQMFPNPVTQNAFVKVQLEKESVVTMEIYSVTGALISSRNYGKLANAQIIPVNTANLNSGIYFVKVTVEGKPSLIKFVKE